MLIFSMCVFPKPISAFNLFAACVNKLAIFAPLNFLLVSYASCTHCNNFLETILISELRGKTNQLRLTTQLGQCYKIGSETLI